MSTAANTVSDTTAWHALPQREVVERLVTDSGKGLSQSEASDRLQKYGPNRLPEGRKRSTLARFFSHFNNVLFYVLLAAGFTKLMMGVWIDAGIILAVVLLNALLGFLQRGEREEQIGCILKR